MAKPEYNLKYNPLLSSGEIARSLGLDVRSVAWKKIRTILIEDYGMRHIPGMGHRIIKSNYENFLKNFFEMSIN